MNSSCFMSMFLHPSAVVFQNNWGQCALLELAHYTNSACWFSQYVVWSVQYANKFKSSSMPKIPRWNTDSRRFTVHMHHLLLPTMHSTWSEFVMEENSKTFTRVAEGYKLKCCYLLSLLSNTYTSKTNCSTVTVMAQRLKPTRCVCSPAHHADGVCQLTVAPSLVRQATWPTSCRSCET